MKDRSLREVSQLSTPYCLNTYLARIGYTAALSSLIPVPHQVPDPIILSAQLTGIANRFAVETLCYKRTCKREKGKRSNSVQKFVMEIILC